MNEKKLAIELNLLWIIACMVAIILSIDSCRIVRLEKSLKALEAARPIEETK